MQFINNENRITAMVDNMNHLMQKIMVLEMEHDAPAYIHSN